METMSARIVFRQFREELLKVRRFDTIVESKNIQLGEVERPGGGTQLAVELDGREVVTLEPRAQAALVGQWGIPNDHFERLPRELQAAELNHFSRTLPKTLTFRNTAAGASASVSGSARAVLSGRYSPFDTVEVLDAIEPYVGDWELQRPDIRRDESVIVVTRPEVHDVSARKVGDLVKSGLTIRNSEVGTMSLGAEFSLWRLVCMNGAVCPEAEVSVRQRHIFVDKRAFQIQLRNAVANVAEIGEAMIRQLRASHDLRLPNLDESDGKLQREVATILRREGLWTKTFQQEASLFGLVQYLTDAFAKNADIVVRHQRERAAGKLMALAQ